MGSHMHMPMELAFPEEDDVSAPWELIARGRSRSESGKGERDTHPAAMFRLYSGLWTHDGSLGCPAMPDILQEMGVDADILQVRPTACWADREHGTQSGLVACGVSGGVWCEWCEWCGVWRLARCTREQ